MDILENYCQQNKQKEKLSIKYHKTGKSYKK